MIDLLSRKFLLSIAILIAVFVLVLTGKSEVNQFIDLAKVVLGIYVTGNVTTDLVNRK